VVDHELDWLCSSFFDTFLHRYHPARGGPPMVDVALSPEGTKKVSKNEEQRISWHHKDIQSTNRT